jgi:hypothetical protein
LGRLDDFSTQEGSRQHLSKETPMNCALPHKTEHQLCETVNRFELSEPAEFDRNAGSAVPKPSFKPWSRNYPHCQNCRSVRFKHKAKGYCGRCHRLVKKLERVDQWDPNDRRSLTGCPVDPVRVHSAYFERIKNHMRAQIERRLFALWAKEEKLKGMVKGIDVEYLLGRLARACRVRKKALFQGVAGCIDEHFDGNQRKLLFEMLNRIEENLPAQAIKFSPGNAQD